MILEETEDGTFTVEPYVMELEMSDDRGLKSLQLDIEGAVGYGFGKKRGIPRFY